MLKIINDTKKRGNKIISVGTTSTRTLETIGDENGFVKAQSVGLIFSFIQDMSLRLWINL